MRRWYRIRRAFVRRGLEVSCDTRLGRVEESEDVLVGIDEVSVDRAVIGHDERNIETEGLPEEGIDLGE